MITVEAALEHLFSLVSRLDTETIPLTRAAGRILADPVTAGRNQPPFAASAMDGYAVADADVQAGATLRVVGESAAGHRFENTLTQGQAVRIFTGAPMPAGADRVVIQEDVDVSGDVITLGHDLDNAPHVRPAGTDFKIGDRIEAFRKLSANDIALLAAMNVAKVPVVRKPVVALISTGDELVMPGDSPTQDQIIASNTFGLSALLKARGAHPRILPIARDSVASLTTAFGLVDDADLVVTIGGASVGDHDLVAQVAADLGMRQSFYKVAMRPGKPLMAGKMGNAAMIGLPGNPVSAMVCGYVFLLPVIQAMLGLGKAQAPRRSLPLAHAMSAGGKREHYMRATVVDGQVHVANRQDSALLSVLSSANALAVQPVGAAAMSSGDLIDIIDI